MKETEELMLSAAAIKSAALSVGFDDCGIAAATPIEGYAHRLNQWISKGCHGEMSFMERYCDLRSDPTKLLPGARSVICVVSSYNPSQIMTEAPRIARYAYGEDYHERLKRMLYHLIGKIHEEHPTFDGRPCVDTAPIAEKYWAARAGLGWIGRHTLLIHPRLGSWSNLGEIVTTFETDSYDQPMKNLCGDCHRCVQACPNKALIECQPTEDGFCSMLDATRCASYHTIENRSDTLPANLHLSGYLFGCDCCQQACPYNRHAPASIDISDDRIRQLQSLSTCDEKVFRHLSRHSALNRIRYNQLERNRNVCRNDVTDPSETQQNSQPAPDGQH